jgi:hypothetical protein
VPPAGGVFLLEHALAVSPVLVGSIPGGGGDVELLYTLPPLPGGLDAVTLHVQFVALATGGPVLGGASVLTILADG